jgi:hypothetical protein
MSEIGATGLPGARGFLGQPAIPFVASSPEAARARKRSESVPAHAVLLAMSSCTNVATGSASMTASIAVLRLA